MSVRTKNTLIKRCRCTILSLVHGSDVRIQIRIRIWIQGFLAAFGFKPQKGESGFGFRKKSVDSVLCLSVTTLLPPGAFSVLSAGFKSGFGLELPGFRFKKIEMDSDSSGFGFEMSGFGSRFQMSGFAHHWFYGIEAKGARSIALFRL